MRLGFMRKCWARATSVSGRATYIMGVEMIGRAKAKRGLKFLQWDRNGSRVVKNYIDEERGLILCPPGSLQRVSRSDAPSL
jgi:hypothetical protein